MILKKLIIDIRGAMYEAIKAAIKDGSDSVTATVETPDGRIELELFRDGEVLATVHHDYYECSFRQESTNLEDFCAKVVTEMESWQEIEEELNS